MTKILERPKCSNPNCNEPGWCMYGRKFYCGRCLEKIINVVNDKKEKETMEIFG